MEASVMDGGRYRWVVLAVGTAAQAAVSASWFAVAILAPDIRSQGRLVRAFPNDSSERQGGAGLAPAVGLIRSLSAPSGA